MLTPANWDALIDIGHRINERLLSHQLEACQCAPDATTLQRVGLPSAPDGLPAPGLRFGEPRTMALLACVCSYAPVRWADQPHPARAGCRTDPRLQRAANDLRPQAPATQRVHPADPQHPTLRADQSHGESFLALAANSLGLMICSSSTSPKPPYRPPASWR